MTRRGRGRRRDASRRGRATHGRRENRRAPGRTHIETLDGHRLAIDHALDVHGLGGHGHGRGAVHLTRVEVVSLMVMMRLGHVEVEIGRAHGQGRGARGHAWRETEWTAATAVAGVRVAVDGALRIQAVDFTFI